MATAAFLAALMVVSPLTIAASALGEQAATVTSDDEWRQELRDVTDKILLCGVDLERFSLRYRLKGTKRSNVIGWQYFGTQEAGAAGILAFSTIGSKEFNRGRRDPEAINVGNLRKGADAGLITAVIAGSGSAVSLMYNTAVAIGNHGKGFGSAQAERFVRSRLNTLDELMKRRDALVAAHSDHLLAPLAVHEGKILRLMREAFVLEFATFDHDVRRLRVEENLFYALNSTANALAAISAFYIKKGLANPRFNAHANIIYTIYGAIATLSPALGTAAGVLSGRLAWRRLRNAYGGIASHPAEDLAVELATTKQLLVKLDPDGTAVPRGLLKSAIYDQSSTNFQKELDFETRIMRYLNSVAAQSDLFGPAIGGTALAQGILGTVGHYRYEHDAKRESKLDYAGSVSGIVGGGLGVGVTAAAMIFDIYYARRLARQHKLPEQLIEERLKHIDEVEQALKAR